MSTRRAAQRQAKPVGKCWVIHALEAWGRESPREAVGLVSLKYQIAAKKPILPLFFRI